MESFKNFQTFQKNLLLSSSGANIKLSKPIASRVFCFLLVAFLAYSSFPNLQRVRCFKRPEGTDNGELPLITGDTTNKVLNEKGKQFWAELKPIFEESYAEVFLQLSKLVSVKSQTVT
jgi:hypothetical protein